MTITKMLVGFERPQFDVQGVHLGNGRLGHDSRAARADVLASGRRGDPYSFNRKDDLGLPPLEGEVWDAPAQNLHREALVYVGSVAVLSAGIRGGEPFVTDPEPFADCSQRFERGECERQAQRVAGRPASRLPFLLALQTALAVDEAREVGRLSLGDIHV